MEKGEGVSSQQTIFLPLKFLPFRDLISGEARLFPRFASRVSFSVDCVNMNKTIATFMQKIKPNFRQILNQVYPLKKHNGLEWKSGEISLFAE